jgi:hypothetical protein
MCVNVHKRKSYSHPSTPPHLVQMEIDVGHDMERNITCFIVVYAYALWFTVRRSGDFSRPTRFWCGTGPPEIAFGAMSFVCIFILANLRRVSDVRPRARDDYARMFKRLHGQRILHNSLRMHAQTHTHTHTHICVNAYIRSTVFFVPRVEVLYYMHIVYHLPDIAVFRI